jgi:16S rRNA (uracil1498-N3)-methyltransferase
MPRFYLPPASWTAGAALTGDEARHLSQVLRIKPGETLTVFDGKGRRAQAEVMNVSRDRVPLRLGEISPTVVPRPSITLAQAIPKGKNMDLIVQKAVELGVSLIQPLVTCNTVVQPGEGKAEKWRRTALEACKQCGQDTLPTIAEPLTLEQWLEHSKGDAGLRIIASLTPEAQILKNIFRVNPEPGDVTLLIGPEGDFTAEETSLAVDQGFLAASLGSIVLRVETASIFCLSVARCEYGV